jgi:glycosyltransferase involved in cell wall biosynthesis
LSGALPSYGWTSHVVTISSPQLGTSETVSDHDGVTVRRVRSYPFTPTSYDARFLQQNLQALEGGLAELTAVGEVDLIVCHGTFFATAAAALQEVTGVPLVYHAHNLFSAPQTAVGDFEAGFLLDVETDIIRRADGIIPISDYIAKMCLELGSDPAKMQVIPKGLWLDQYQGSWRPPDAPTVFFAGRFSQEKGLETLFEAAAVLVREGFDLRILLAGAGDARYVEELQATVDLLGLRRHVWFTGVLSGAQLLALYQTTSVTVVPSYMEALGRVALEAMAAGAPVVITDVGGLGPLVQPGMTGWRVPPRDPSALAAAIREAVTDPRRARQLAAAGRAFVTAHFAYPTVIQATAEFYSLVQRRQRP